MISSILFFLLVVAPFMALFLAFSGSDGTRQLARFTLLCAWMAYGGGTVWCLWTGLFGKSSGIGNGIFVIIAVPVGVFAGVFFNTWLSALEHERKQSLGTGWRP